MNLDVNKNTAQSTHTLWSFENGFEVLKTINNTDKMVHSQREIPMESIHFHFSLKGASTFLFNEGHYKRPLKEEMALLMYNPQTQLPFEVDMQSGACLLSVFIAIKKFHLLFSQDTHYINFLSKENRNEKYYKEVAVTPTLATILHQINTLEGSSSVSRLYIKAKTYELLSQFFNQQGNPDIEQCPFLADGENIDKIRMVKEIIVSQMAQPPSLAELADEVGISLKKLNTGFKQIYGDSVFNFLFDYKMQYATSLLENGRHNVSEISYKLGYSTPSHFIEGFKKKFGVTPKQYSKSL